ncbi:CENP-B like protein 2, partial [Dictyocoela muelleri]
KKITEAFIKNPKLKTTFKKLKYPIIDRKLKEWVDMIERNGGYITEKILQTKAIQIYREDANGKEDGFLIEKKFNASNGFLYKFKKRHVIVLKQCSGESYNINNQNFDEFLKLFKSKLSEYGPDNVFNCDGTGLFYKLAPNKA